MSKSMQDQLLALGLASKKPSKQKRPTGKAAQRRRKAGPVGDKIPPGELTLEQAYALKKKDEQKRADQARREKQEEDRRRKKLNHEIRSIVKTNRLNHDDAEIARNFMFRGRIRKVHVTPDQLQALNSGELGIAYLSGGYHLLTKEHTEQVRGLSADHVPNLVESRPDEDEGEFPVPDDLTW
ncbi:MAG: DUF2058 family protein [Xanthomonadales bacterium]|nr:DUF2058 domain-containing protein [Gammaproteobacteria bacterium]MBT8053870.1 DUF2058 domain-containing protein [Gammaproteobacteria bacterium]NNK52078.1 DUF2058 family protein [Xanthomonadales bacterium]